LALRLSQAGQEVTLLARGETLRRLERNGIHLTDGLTVPRAEGGLAMTRVLVAGASGYLGLPVAQELSARAYFVRALVRSLDKAERLRSVVDELVAGIP